MGLVNTLSGQFDLSIPSDLQNKLQDTPGGGFIDLAAFNINRGRDHGLPGYTKYVSLCTGRTISSFSDLTSLNWNNITISRMSGLYR
jgi:hypothetical protein